MKGVELNAFKLEVRRAHCCLVLTCVGRYIYRYHMRMPCMACVLSYRSVVK